MRIFYLKDAFTFDLPRWRYLRYLKAEIFSPVFMAFTSTIYRKCMSHIGDVANSIPVLLAEIEDLWWLLMWFVPYQNHIPADFLSLNAPLRSETPCDYHRPTNQLLPCARPKRFVHWTTAVPCRICTVNRPDRSFFSRR